MIAAWIVFAVVAVGVTVWGFDIWTERRNRRNRLRWITAFTLRFDNLETRIQRLEKLQKEKL